MCFVCRRRDRLIKESVWLVKRSVFDRLLAVYITNDGGGLFLRPAVVIATRRDGWLLLIRLSWLARLFLPRTPTRGVEDTSREKEKRREARPTLSSLPEPEEGSSGRDCLSMWGTLQAKREGERRGLDQSWFPLQWGRGGRGWVGVISAGAKNLRSVCVRARTPGRPFSLSLSNIYLNHLLLSSFLFSPLHVDVSLSLFRHSIPSSILALRGSGPSTCSIQPIDSLSLSLYVVFSYLSFHLLALPFFHTYLTYRDRPYTMVSTFHRANYRVDAPDVKLDCLTSVLSSRLFRCLGLVDVIYPRSVYVVRRIQLTCTAGGINGSSTTFYLYNLIDNRGYWFIARWLAPWWRGSANTDEITLLSCCCTRYPIQRPTSFLDMISFNLIYVVNHWTWKPLYWMPSVYTCFLYLWYHSLNVEN